MTTYYECSTNIHLPSLKRSFQKGSKFKVENGVLTSNLGISVEAGDDFNLLVRYGCIKELAGAQVDIYEHEQPKKADYAMKVENAEETSIDLPKAETPAEAIENGADGGTGAYGMKVIEVDEKASEIIPLEIPNLEKPLVSVGAAAVREPDVQVTAQKTINTEAVVSVGQEGSGVKKASAEMPVVHVDEPEPTEAKPERSDAQKAALEKMQQARKEKIAARRREREAIVAEIEKKGAAEARQPAVQESESKPEGESNAL